MHIRSRPVSIRRLPARRVGDRSQPPRAARTPGDGLALVDRLVVSGELTDYHLLHATRADLLRRLGRTAEAAAAYREALSRAPAEAERRYLTRRLQETGSG
jgi:RNA polymerase sigma-70 factor, ECF subfamily